MESKQEKETLVSDPDLQWGSLHGQPCTLEEYFDIAISDSGRYDLVDGKLVAREMPDSNHDDLANAYKSAYDANSNPDEKGYVTASIAIPIVPDAKESKHFRYRTPDFSVGRKLSEAEKKDLPPGCRDVRWTTKNPPKRICEITSYNEKTDFKDKTEDYAKAKVQEYMIVDRDKHNKGTKNHNPTIWFGQLEGGSYKFNRYNHDSTQKVGPSGPLHHTPQVLHDPEKLEQITAEKKANKENALREERRKAEEERRKAEQREKREKEARLKAEEERRKAEEERRKAEEERRKAEQREKREKEARLKAEEERRKAEEERRKAEEERRKAEQREKREKEARRKAEQRERREKEERVKAEEERRKAKDKERKGKRKRKVMRERLKRLGEPVSDSSSCSSPSRKK